VTQRDPGAAGERTFLAWHRTGLAFLVIAAILVRGGEPVVAALGLLVALGYEAIAYARLRATPAGGPLPPALAVTVARATTAAIAVVALAAAVTV